MKADTFENAQTSTKRLIQVKEDKTPLVSTNEAPLKTISIVPYSIDESSNDSITNVEPASQPIFDGKRPPIRTDNDHTSLISDSLLRLDSFLDYQHCENSHPVVINPAPVIDPSGPTPPTAVNTYTMPITDRNKLQKKNFSFPLRPDFTDFARDSEVELEDYNLTKEDFERTKKALNTPRSRTPPTPILERTFPPEVLAKMWPQARPSIKINPNQKLTENTEKETITIPDNQPLSGTPVKDNPSKTPNSSLNMTSSRSTLSLDSTISSSEENYSDSTASDTNPTQTQTIKLRRNFLHEIGEKVSLDFKRKCCIEEEPLIKNRKYKME